MRNRKIIVLFLNQNIYCVYSKEPSQFEHPKHMLKMWVRIILPFYTDFLFILTYVLRMYPFLSKRRSWSVIMQYLTIFRPMEFSMILKPTYSNVMVVDNIRLYFQKILYFFL